MIKAIFLTLSLAILTPVCFPADTQNLSREPYSKEDVEVQSRAIANRIAYDIENGRLSERVDEALNTLVKMGTWHLKERGMGSVALRLEFEYNEQFLGFMTRTSRAPHNIPDIYEPLSDWLRNFYNTLEFVLGEPFMITSRLFDIKVINNCIPVTFCMYDIEMKLKDVDDYYPYFQALVGTVSYWVSNGVCIGLTWGAGTFWLCSPVAWATENVMEKFLAPKIVNPAYGMFCKKE